MMSPENTFIAENGDRSLTGVFNGLALSHAYLTSHKSNYSHLARSILQSMSTDGHGNEWTLTYPYTDPEQFDRLNANRLFLGFAFAPNGSRSKMMAINYYRKCFERSFTHQSGELVLEFGFIIRLFHLWTLYPILLILDLRFIIEPLFFPDRDFTLVIPDLFYAKEHFPTPWLWIASGLIKNNQKIRQGMKRFYEGPSGCKELESMINDLFGRL